MMEHNSAAASAIDDGDAEDYIFCYRKHMQLPSQKQR
jgi:hypothetical protein